MGNVLPRLAEWTHFCVAGVGAGHGVGPFHSIRPDFFQMAYLAAEELSRRGYRRIGLPLEEDAKQIRFRHAGGLLAAQFLGVSPPVCAFVHRVDNQDPQALAAWVRRHRIEAVLSLGDHVCSNLVLGGIRIPEDCAFVHLNTTKDIDGLAGVMSDPVELGMQAARLLHELLLSNRRGAPAYPSVVRVNGVWREGKSVLDAKKKH
jgi:DNA-binding LacI/PurR family transcriptional regulator